jgi:hypothetical protein
MGFFDWLFGSAGVGSGDSRVMAAVDRVIEGTDPRLKAVSGARERLAPAVEKALAYVDSTLVAIPAGVELSPENWSATPLLRAFFTRPADIPAAIAASRDVREFLKQPASTGMDVLHGVVAATRVERTVLGHAMEGDMLRQDVAQKTVSFSDLRIAGFTADEATLRGRLSDFVLEQLVLAALRGIADNRQRSGQLEAYRQLLQTRLRLLEQSAGGLDAVLEGAAEELPDIARLRGQLAANEAELSAIRPAGGGLESCLDPVIAALHDAESIIRPKLLTLRLNAMNILVGDDVADAADIRLVEFSTANPERPRRVGFLAHFPRSAFVEKVVDFDALLRSI